MKFAFRSVTKTSVNRAGHRGQQHTFDKPDAYALVLEKNQKSKSS